jgi:hypothetical protein
LAELAPTDILTSIEPSNLNDVAVLELTSENFTVSVDKLSLDLRVTLKEVAFNVTFADDQLREEY